MTFTHCYTANQFANPQQRGLHIPHIPHIHIFIHTVNLSLNSHHPRSVQIATFTRAGLTACIHSPTSAHSVAQHSGWNGPTNCCCCCCYYCCCCCCCSVQHLAVLAVSLAYAPHVHRTQQPLLLLLSWWRLQVLLLRQHRRRPSPNLLLLLLLLQWFSAASCSVCC